MSVESVLLPKAKYDKLMKRLTQQSPDKNPSESIKDDTGTMLSRASQRIQPTLVNSKDDHNSRSGGVFVDSDAVIGKDRDESESEGEQNVVTINPTQKERTLEEIYNNHKKYLPPYTKMSDVIGETHKKEKTKNILKKDKKKVQRPVKKPYSRMRSKWLTL